MPSSLAASASAPPVDARVGVDAGVCARSGSAHTVPIHNTQAIRFNMVR